MAQALTSALRDDPVAVLGRARETLARMQSIAVPRSQPLREWSVLLDRPAPAIVEILADPSPWARELRHVTPFAGVLSAAERTKALRAFAEAETERRRG